MADSVSKRILIVAYAKATTWGTVATFGTGDGLRVEELSGNFRQRRLSKDNSAGQGFENNSFHGVDEPPTPTFMTRLQENDSTAFLPIAQIIGTDVVTGSSAPYTHTMTTTNEANKFGSLGWQEGDEVFHTRSFKPETVELAPNDDGIWEANVSGKADAVIKGTSTDLNTVTFDTRSNVFLLQNTTVRINAQSDGALDSADEIEVSDLKITLSRPSDSVIVSGSGAILEPKEGEYPEFTVEFTLPRKIAASKTLYDAFVADTLQKMDIVITGSTANFELKLEFPQVFMEEVSNIFDNIVRTEVKCRIQKATSAPTGMAFTMPTVTWLCEQADSLL